MTYKPSEQEVLAAFHAIFTRTEFNPRTPGHPWWYSRISDALIAAHAAEEDTR